MGYPLFTGENESQQLACIMEYKGIPPWGLLVAAKRAKYYFDLEYKPLLEPTKEGKIRYPSTRTFA